MSRAVVITTSSTDVAGGPDSAAPIARPARPSSFERGLERARSSPRCGDHFPRRSAWDLHARLTPVPICVQGTTTGSESSRFKNELLKLIGGKLTASSGTIHLFRERGELIADAPNPRVYIMTQELRWVRIRCGCPCRRGRRFGATFDARSEPRGA
jgi:hypothetical protein